MSAAEPILLEDIRRRELARELAGLQYTVDRLIIGGWSGLDLHDSTCALCGGRFASVGFARGFYDKGGVWTVLHEGCFREADCWADPPTTPEAA